MAVGLPLKTTYANGDVYSASDVNDTNGTINAFVNPYFAGKNAVINGAMDVWQRGTSIVTSGAYTADRYAEVSGNSITYTRSTDVPASLGFQYSMSRAGTGSNVVQRIESANAARLAGQTVTLSFYYKSTAGADSFSTFFYYANSADNFAGLTQIGSTQTIATPSTSWTRVSYTYTSISANAANGLAIYFARGNGATSTTLITGVQLEVGSTATTFSRAGATIQNELAACQRYYNQSSVNGINNSGGAGTVSGIATTTQLLMTGIRFPVQMRVAPTVNLGTNGANTPRRSDTGITATMTSVASVIGTQSVSFWYSSTAVLTANAGYDFDYTASAEL
jgi:hypothetical protein